MEALMRNESRKWQFELLRIIAMCMIIAMHYMTKGMKLPKLSEDLSIFNMFYWLLYAFCVVAVNTYVLISGYFLCSSEAGADNCKITEGLTKSDGFNILKLLKLWLQVFIYSVFVPLVLGAFGIVGVRAFDLSVWQQIVFPLQYEHYWFATSYILLYAISPLLVAAVRNLDKKILKKVIVVLIITFCGFKSINPYLIPWDRYGCDVLWFICLFLLAGYIGKYGIKYFSSLNVSLIIYILFSILTFLIATASAFVVRSIGKLEYYMDMTYSYNYITVLIASVALFYVFLKWNEAENVKNEGHGVTNKVDKIINFVAARTFGVYLLHDNLVIRNRWQTWLGIDTVAGKPWQIFHLLLSVALVFAIGVIIDVIRRGIFEAFKRMGGKTL